MVQHRGKRKALRENGEIQCQLRVKLLVNGLWSDGRKGLNLREKDSQKKDKSDLRKGGEVFINAHETRRSLVKLVLGLSNVFLLMWFERERESGWRFSAYI